MNTVFVATHGGTPTHTSASLEAVQREAVRAQKRTADGGLYDYQWLEQGPGHWRLWKKPKGGRLVPAVGTARSVTEVAYVPDEKTTVNGPFPVLIAASPGGADLDASAFLMKAVFAELIAKADDDPKALVQELADTADLLRTAVHQGRNSHARHAFDEKMRELLKEFANDGVIPVYGEAVSRMAERLSQIATPRSVPGQREAGAA